jgi:hypothetical protein
MTIYQNFAIKTYFKSSDITRATFYSASIQNHISIIHLRTKFSYNLIIKIVKLTFLLSYIYIARSIHIPKYLRWSNTTLYSRVCKSVMIFYYQITNMSKVSLSPSVELVLIKLAILILFAKYNLIQEVYEIYFSMFEKPSFGPMTLKSHFLPLSSLVWLDY